jgi:CHAT domain-containing protein
VWGALADKFKGRIYAFEHATFSESPIRNAIQLADALPAGARLNLVTHSRGGIVGDLLCLADLEKHIANYHQEVAQTGDRKDVSDRLLKEMRDAHAEQRADLATLAALLQAKQFVIERYVRVASPAAGTKLASANFDLFLSGLLSLIGTIPLFFGQPLYMAFKRIVIEIAKNRTNPRVVPGIEAMLPDAPMARLLREAQPKPGITMSVIAGDVEGGNLLLRLGVLLTDFLLFDHDDHDLVVNTASMLAGIAPACNARALFDRGPDVNHFSYFGNRDTGNGVRDWLLAKEPQAIDAFQALPQRFDGMDTIEAETQRLREITSHRGGDAADLPVVVVLPGVMGSYLWVNRKDRVWFDLPDIATGGLKKIAWGQPDIEAEKLFGRFYGDLVDELAKSHRVERFHYDWRQPLDVLGERFGEFLSGLMSQTQQPIRLLAHSMGGLVVRACIHQRRPLMDELMQRDGARFVMLGTPNQGAHSMVENLLGKGDTLRTLVRLDLSSDMQEVLDIVAGFRGAVQLLPKKGFVDTFQGSDDGGMNWAYDDVATWEQFKSRITDFWFGDKRCGVPTKDALHEATWLWRQDGEARPALPAAYENKTVYVFGVSPNTPCGVRVDEKGRLKMVGTTRGDGTVSWDSGRIDHIGRFYYMPAEHGALPSTAEYFPALIDLLGAGATARLDTSPPGVRAIEDARPRLYDAGPPQAGDPGSAAMALLGRAPKPRLVSRARQRLSVSVCASDLRFINVPIMVGHYEHDPIAGPQGLIDRELLGGDLSERYRLGLYCGPRGTATAVLRRPNDAEARRGTLRGAVVCGLGPYERPLSQRDLTESVRAGALRYLMQVVDVLGEDDREVSLATLLIGYNSSANLAVSDSIEALVTGVIEANAKFRDTMQRNVRIASLQIVEIYLDTAITAVYALRDLSGKLNDFARQQQSALVCAPQLSRGEGWRQRLFDRGSLGYWPRLIVTEARGSDDAPPPRAATSGARRDTVAERLRYLYVGQRARAESVVQQRQPGLVEELVRQQIDKPVWNDDIGKALFQLMVPLDFKDAARQLRRVVLVLDDATANLPWELMSADDPEAGEKLPLAVRAAVVRQLETRDFRRHVREAYRHRALAIGNPSVEGFGAKFGHAKDPDALPHAEAEAQAVAAILRGVGYECTEVIGEGRRASDVFAALYRQPYRFVHVSAHGVFDARHQDGLHRTGVVLSDGLLITAAEIEAMETVPELVFLNCCHLGKLDVTVRDGNKLAASIARELIRIGVRCVVVAGWAVNDERAALFGQTFYRALLADRKTFGDAVFEARKATWKDSPGDITWGAFQAYGDAGWSADPPRDGGTWSPEGEFATPDEALDELASLRAGVSRRLTNLTEREARAQAEAVQRLIKRLPSGWAQTPALLSALGRTWADLGVLDRARETYLRAVQAEDRSGSVPIRDLEQLANVEARLGEKQGQAGDVKRAIKRLETLDGLVSETSEGGNGRKAESANPERWALRGSAYKRLASLHARQVLKEHRAAKAPAKSAADDLRKALADSVQAYRSAEGVPGRPQFSPYHVLNRYALEAVLHGGAIDAAQHESAIEMVRQSQSTADEGFRADGDFYNAVMGPEGLLVIEMIEGRLGQSGDEGDAALARVKQRYGEAFDNLTVKPKDLDSVVGQLCVLSRLHDAMAVIHRGRNAARANRHLRTADRLIELGEFLVPRGCVRDDRPKDGGDKGEERRGAARATKRRGSVAGG